MNSNETLRTSNSKTNFSTIAFSYERSFFNISKKKKEQDIHLEVDSGTEAYQTISTEIKKGFLTKVFDGGKKPIQVVALPLDNFLVLVVSSNEKTASCSLYAYKQIELRNYVSPNIKNSPPVEDFGLQILGYIDSGLEKLSYFLGLEDNANGKELIQLLKEKVSSENV